MTDTSQKRRPTPHLQTRPATMLTAIGLCALIILLQVVPQIGDVATHLPTTVANAR